MCILQRKTGVNYLTCMETRYQTLQTLYTLVKETPNPTQYQCLPRQLILFLHFDWATIYSHLQVLAEEDLVMISQADNIQFSITDKGIAKAVSLATAKEKLSAG